MENRNLWRRRAIVGILLDEGRAMTVGEIVERLVELRPTGERLGAKDVADALRYQVGLGRVRRVARGTYAAMPTQMSTSMRWRCRAAAR